MQNQPVMSIAQKLLRHQSNQPFFDLQHVIARGNTGAVGYPKDVGIHRHGGVAIGGIQYHIGGFPPHTG